MPKTGSLPTKPLEFNDFSGGITENILQGDPRRYEKGDNFFITTDHKLEERLGFLPESDSSYKITGFEGQRINNYHLVHNDTVRMPQCSRALFILDTDQEWTQIIGVAGNQALSGGDSDSQTTSSEFQRVIYFATDGRLDGTLPSKVYINENGDWTAKTAGLPRSYVSGNYTTAGLLAQCIANANAIRAAMILHFQDAKYPIFRIPALNEIAPAGQLHINVDRYSLCYLQTVNDFSILEPKPNPLPTPQGPATDLASLLALVGVLNTIYGLHIADGMKNSWGTQIGSALVSPTPKPTYHQDNGVYSYSFAALDFPVQRTKGPGATLNDTGVPTTLEEAAAMLDDLLQKWNWHRKSVNTHHYQNDPLVFDRYQPSCSAIGTANIGTKFFPTITPDWGDVIGFANNLRYLYNLHLNTVGNTGAGHKMRDNFLYNWGFECRLPDATTLDDAYLLIYWLRSLYQLHYYDASFLVPNFQILKFNTTAGSNTLSTVTVNSSGATFNGSFVTGQFVEIAQGVVAWNPQANKYNAFGQYTTARCVAGGGSGTIVIDSTANTTQTGQFLQIAIPMYHDYRVNGLPQDNFSTNAEQGADQLSNDVTTLGVDTKTWLLLGQDLFFALGSHMTYGTVHAGSTTTFQNQLTSVPNPPFYVPSVATYSYAMFFQDRYTVEPNGIEYLVHGNPVFSDSTECTVSYPVGTTPPNLYPNFYSARPIVTTRGNQLTNLPVLTNDATTNYDTSNITLEIYRTTDGGTTFFHLASLPNGTTSYLDTVNDSIEATDGTLSLDEGEELYTTGGVVGDDQPPVCKYTHVLNGIVYWGAVTDNDQFFPNRIRQSKEGAPDAAPQSFFDDLDSPVMGISSARNNLIVFCATSIYRMAGQFDSQGKGQITHENISDTLGCLNAKSIVRTEIGVFFAGTDGFYYTDGYQIINITYELKNTYAQYTQTENQRLSIYGAYDKIQRRVWWAMKTGLYDSDNSIVFVFYLQFGVKPSGVFTTISNGLNFRPSSLVIQDGVPYIAHEKGFLLKLDKWNKWDAIIDEVAPADQWVHSAIPYHYRSVAIDLGTTFQRKWIPRIHLVGKNTGNMAIQTSALRDVNQYNQGSVPLAPINYVQNCTWGDPNFVWGDPNFIWKTDGKMDLWRRIPAGSLRSDFMQIELTPADLCVYASSNWPSFCYAQVTGSSGGGLVKQISILTPSGYTDIVWPRDMVNYRIKFSFDNYEREFTVTGYLLDEVITVSDPDNFLVVGPNNYDWEVWGVKKEQNVFLTSFVLHYSYLGQQNQAYPGATTDSGPGNAGENP